MKSILAATAPFPFWKTSLFLFLAVVLLSMPQAALLPLLDRDEPRFAEASREMLQSGDIVVPTFNHLPRYAKPPLIYWCQATSFAVLGENAFAARLPSILATAGTAVLILAWGVQLGTMQMGLGAAFSYAFCLQVIQQGRVATADALMIFFMTLTGYAGWKLLTEVQTDAFATKLEGGSKKKRAPAKKFSTWHWHIWGTILALGLAGGFLAKGPEALLPVLPILFCARSCGWRVLLSLAAIFLLGLFIVSWWAIPAYVQTNGEYWQEGLGHDVGDRMIGGNFQGHGASSLGWYLLLLPIYLLTFWLSALPWSPLLLTHGKKLFSKWKPDPIDLYLLLNAGLIFLIFSLMATKLPHYTLPAFPFLVLFFARRWVSAGLSAGFLTELGWTTGIVLALLALIAIPVVLAFQVTPSPVGTLIREAGETLTPETEFALIDFQEPNAIWEMRSVVYSPAYFPPMDKIIPFLNQTGPRAVILSTALWQQLRTQADPSWKIYEARGFNAAKFSALDLTLVVNSGGAL